MTLERAGDLQRLATSVRAGKAKAPRGDAAHATGNHA